MFVATKLLKIGYNQAKKHKANKQQAQFQQPHPNYTYPNPYPMSEYPPGVAPGTNTQYISPEPPAEPISKGAKLLSMIISILRFLQFVFGLTVIGLYGRDVHHDHKEDDTYHPKWVFALVVGFLATSTAGFHMVLPFLMKRVNMSRTPNPKLYLPQFVWEAALCIIWLVVFGIFGEMYIGVYASTSSSTSTTTTSSSKRSTSSTAAWDAAKITRMRHAVWIDLVNLLMWVFTASWVLVRWLKSRRAAMAAAAALDAEKANQI
ncbi:hypothetical protein N7466_000391 [Penicillium verhagenii]|uniref:uncharacterized protein n=1 Tax=Penicillium verhagenii TaxID=1562060 RepID=UPI002544EF5A|nr:uncharacterized protein N7466_000391 [Penicillium verhagenii]KAJ5947376.1 hypothetical protein N7466_000391 [Penicillium verhagenii]